MSLLDLEKLDLVTRLPGDDRVALVAVDSGDVTETAEREDAFQKKVAVYFQVVASGQFSRLNPQLADREPFILVVCVNPPTEGMAKVTSVGDPAHPETYLTIEIITHAAFLDGLKRKKESGDS